MYQAFLEVYELSNNFGWLFVGSIWVLFENLCSSGGARDSHLLRCHTTFFLLSQSEPSACGNSHPPLSSFPQATDLGSHGHMLGQSFPRDPQLWRSVKGTVLEPNGDCQYLLFLIPSLLLAFAAPWKYCDTWFPSLCLPDLVLVSGLFSRSLGKKKTDKGVECALYTSHVFFRAFLSPLLLYKLLKLRPKIH